MQAQGARVKPTGQMPTRSESTASLELKDFAATESSGVREAAADTHRNMTITACIIPSELLCFTISE
jgi:hypothetical protein